MTRPYVQTIKAAREFAQISNGNTKMPGTTFSQSARACHIGQKLAKIEGSVCKSCYALKIQNLRPNVNKSWESNTEKARHWIATNPQQWVDACVFQITRAALKSSVYNHRWFDSGDLDSVDQLAAIARVAELTPEIAHWLPTREAGIVKQWLAQGGICPKNLVIRISSTMVGDKPISGYSNTSTVHIKGKEHHGHACPAPSQGNNCGDCRACWNPAVANISYIKH